VRRSAIVRVAAIMAVASMAVASTTVASAVTHPDPPTHVTAPGSLGDADRDGLDDTLEAALASAEPAERFEVVATFREPRSAAAAERTLPASALRARFGLIDGFAATMTAARIRAMATHPGLIRIEPDFAVGVATEAADRDFGTQRARNQFDVSGAGVEICVVDTGVDPGHEQLDSKAPIPFLDLVNDRTTAYDDQGHGTHVASIAAGDGTGGSIAALFNGVAPDAEVSAVKVLSSTGVGQDSDVVLGVEWCAARPSVDVINVSVTSPLGSDGLDAISQAVDAAVTDEGMVVVAAAGNTGDLPGSVASPAAARQAIAVGAVAEWSAPLGEPWRSEGVYLAPFSSRGPTSDGRVKPDIVAPGVSIAAASANSTASYEVKDGTSMASPFVAGLAALILERQPAWTPSQVRSAILGTAYDVGAPGKDPEWGAGLVDGRAAVAQAAGTTASTTFPTYQRFTGAVANGGSWARTFTVAEGDLGVPIAATVTLDGSPTCVLPWIDPPCLWWEWSPDLEAQLLGPAGFALATSTCAAGDGCVSGRQETVHITPTVAGTYTIRVYPGATTGGSFSVDLFKGPAGGATPPAPQVHVGDLDGSSAWVTAKRWRAQVRITVEDAGHVAVPGAVVTGAWTGGKVTTCTTGTTGRCTVSNPYRKVRAAATFTVTSIAKAGVTYASGANHDPDGDSTGTAITVARP
jgi:serine protease AprX